MMTDPDKIPERYTSYHHEPYRFDLASLSAIVQHFNKEDIPHRKLASSHLKETTQSCCALLIEMGSHAQRPQ